MSSMPLRAASAPHILKWILQFDLPGYRHTVLGNARCAVFLFENHIPPFWAERNLDGVGELVYASQDCLPGMVAVNNPFRHEFVLINQGQ
jgi:hypothetical protein